MKIFTQDSSGAVEIKLAELHINSVDKGLEFKLTVPSDWEAARSEMAITVPVKEIDKSVLRKVVNKLIFQGLYRGHKYINMYPEEFDLIVHDHTDMANTQIITIKSNVIKGTC